MDICKKDVEWLWSRLWFEQLWGMRVYFVHVILHLNLKQLQQNQRQTSASYKFTEIHLRWGKFTIYGLWQMWTWFRFLACNETLCTHTFLKSQPLPGRRMRKKPVSMPQCTRVYLEVYQCHSLWNRAVLQLAWDHSFFLLCIGSLWIPTNMHRRLLSPYQCLVLLN